LLRQLGCDHHGFHFSPALEPTQFLAFVKQSRADAGSLTDDEAARTHSKLAVLAHRWGHWPIATLNLARRGLLQFGALVADSS
jgi:hypothetical protein